METALAAAVYLLLAVALAAAALWYVNAVWERFFATDPTPALGPVLVVAADEATSRSYAAALPAMIIGAASELKGRANVAIRALGEAATELSGTVRPVEDVDLPVPDEFRQEIAINLKVADVEVGSLLSFLLERARDRNQLNITVALGADKKDGEVYGHLPGPGGYAFAAKSAGDLPSIARAVAAQLVHRAAQGGESAFAALEPEVFARVVDALGAYARLTAAQRWTLAAADGAPSRARDRLRAEYKAVLDEVRGTAERYSGWEGLQWLAAQSARGAEDWEGALRFYGNLRTLAERAANHALVGRLAGTIGETERRLAESRAVQPASDGSRPPLTPELAAAAAAAAAISLPETLPARRVLGAIGLAEPGGGAGVSIGIVGAGPWPDLLDGAPVEVIGGEAADQADDDLRRYQTAMWQTARLVAPDAHFVFAPIRGGNVVSEESDLIRAVVQLATRKTDVVLLTYGSPEPSAAIDAIVRSVADESIVVLTAGNEAGPSAYRDVADVAVVTAAVAEDGAPAPFSSTAEGAAWAPGVDIPVVSRRTGAVERGSGTSYSAALAAGAAALLKAAHPEATPARVRDALLTTGKPAAGRTEPPVIDVPAALDRLRGTAASTPPQ